MASSIDLRALFSSPGWFSRVFPGDVLKQSSFCQAQIPIPTMATMKTTTTIAMTTPTSFPSESVLIKEKRMS